MATESFPRSGRDVIPDSKLPRLPKLPSLSQIKSSSRFRFGTLLGGFTLAAMAGAVSANRMHTLESQHDRLHNVEAAGTFPELEMFGERERSVREFFGLINIEDQQEWIANQGAQVPFEDLEKLNELKKITLNNETPDIHETVTNIVSRLPNVTQLDLTSTGILTLDPIQQSNLDYLSIARTIVAESELIKLLEAKNLQILDISGISIQPETLNTLIKEHPQLKEIRLYSKPLNPKTKEYLTTFSENNKNWMSDKKGVELNDDVYFSLRKR